MPNPFNIETEISFSLDQSDNVELSIYNVLGQKILDLSTGFFEAGMHTVAWDGTNQAGQTVASGVYFYRLSAENHALVLQKKMILMK